MAKIIVTAHGGDEPTVAVETVDEELDFECIVSYLAGAIEAAWEADAEVAVDVAPGRKFWSTISFQAGHEYGVDHLYYGHVNTDPDEGVGYVNGFVLAAGVRDELDWDYKCHDTAPFEAASGSVYEEYWNQPLGSARIGRLGLVNYRNVHDIQQAHEIDCGTGDEAIVDAYDTYDDAHRSRVLLFSIDRNLLFSIDRNLLFSNDRNFVARSRAHARAPTSSSRATCRGPRRPPGRSSSTCCTRWRSSSGSSRYRRRRSTASGGARRGPTVSRVG